MNCLTSKVCDFGKENGNGCALEEFLVLLTCPTLENQRKYFLFPGTMSMVLFVRIDKSATQVRCGRGWKQIA